MDPTAVGLIAFLALLFFLALGNYVGVGLGIIGVAGFIFLTNFNAGLALLRTTPYTVCSDFSFLAIPLFILMGNFLLVAGIGDDVYDAVYKWLGHVKGGLAIATIFGCAAFGAACGSSPATAATFSKISLPAMDRYGYDKKLAAGCIAAAGTLASMIPPSGIMIVYGILTEQPIGLLLMAGFIPGIISALLYATMIFGWISLRPQAAPSAPERFNWKEKLSAIKYLWSVVILGVIILGGIYVGVFTPTEAAALGVSASFILLIVKRRLSISTFMNGVIGAAETTAMLFMIIIMAFVMSRFLAITGIGTQLISFLSDLRISPILVIIGFLGIYIFLGCFLDAAAMMAITLPIIFPIVLAFGFSGIWFGVLVVKTAEIGLITPPVGINVYTVYGASDGAVELTDVFKGVMPFLLTDIVTMILLVAVPQISLFIPSCMQGHP